jgi:hypothetical protein
MRGSIQVVISGIPDTDYASVIATVLYRDPDNVWRTQDFYRERHTAQDLCPGMAVEPWMLASIAEHTDRIRAALATAINRGSKTLIEDLPRHE